jgi:PAS domain-containing protein
MERKNLKRLRELTEELSVYPSTEREVERVLGMAVPGKALVDKSGNLIYCNDYFVEKLGYTREELLNKPVSTIVPTSEHHKQVLDWFTEYKTITLRNVDAIHKTNGVIKITVGIVQQGQNAAIGMVVV